MECTVGKVFSGSRGFLIYSQGISMLDQALPSPPLFSDISEDKDHHTVSGALWTKYSTGIRKNVGTE